MALKTFNIDEEVYKKFSEHCKSNGMSMSKKIENFIRGEVEGLQGKQGVKKRVRVVRDEEPSFKKYC